MPQDSESGRSQVGIVKRRDFENHGTAVSTVRLLTVFSVSICRSGCLGFEQLHAFAEGFRRNLLLVYIQRCLH